MENASKALIIAGGILIALMIISTLLLMFNRVSIFKNSEDVSTKSDQVVQFNQQYTTYARNDLRGSELYSLLNKVIDYNRRESTEGTRGTTDSTGWSDTGQDINYKAMEVVFTLTNDTWKNLSMDNTHRLIKNKQYTINKNKNAFENDIIGEITDLENKYGQDCLTNLSTVITKIFIDDTRSDEDKNQAVKDFNKLSRKKSASGWNDIKNGSTIREDVYTYYEYIQFKRARFNCTKQEYDDKTGRILKLTFESTGKFN